MTNKNVYEIGLLINPDLSQQETGEMIENIKNIFEKQGASVISEGEVVDMDLAYQIITKIASKNERFDKAHFSWIKFNAETESLAKIKKEVEKEKAKIFRFLITKTVADDEATDKYHEISEEVEEEELDKEKSSEEKSDIIDTTIEDSKDKKEEEKN